MTISLNRIDERYRCVRKIRTQVPGDTQARERILVPVETLLAMFATISLNRSCSDYPNCWACGCARKIVRSEAEGGWACTCKMQVRDAAGRMQEQTLLLLDSMLMWLGSITIGGVDEQYREKLRLYQREAGKALGKAFFPQTQTVQVEYMPELHPGCSPSDGYSNRAA